MRFLLKWLDVVVIVVDIYQFMWVNTLHTYKWNMGGKCKSYIIYMPENSDGNIVDAYKIHVQILPSDETEVVVVFACLVSLSERLVSS